MPGLASLASWTAGRGLGLSPVTLRFEERSREESFAQQRKAALVACSGVLATICTLLELAGLALKFVRITHLRSTVRTDEAYQVHIWQICTFGANVALLLLFLGAVSHRRLVEALRPIHIEVAIITLMTLTMAVGVFTWPSNVSRMHGLAVEDVFDDAWFSGSDAAILLCIDTVVTGTHVGLPVRWHIMFVMEVVAVLLYASTVFVIGSSEPYGCAVFNLVALATLVLFSAFGRRAAELGERRTFVSIIGEKSLRCDAEFRLAQMGDPAEPKPAVVQSSSLSLPTANESERVFGPLPNTGDGDRLSAHLSCMVDMCEREHWRIQEAEVKLVPNGLLGTGSYGVVVLGIFCGMLVAVKRSADILPSIDVQKLPALCNELRILRHIRHPHLAVVYGALVNPQQHQVSLVMEFVEGDTLKKFMAGAPSNLARVQVMIGVCRALLYLHTRRPQIVHGDLKGENVMIEVSGDKVHPKLLDFGLSRLLTRKPRPLGGTLPWMAPEVLLKDLPVGCSADVYSFGRLIAFVATGIAPLAGMPADVIQRVLRSRSPPFPKWPPGCVFEPFCKQLVFACIRANATERPAIRVVHRELLGLPQSLNLAGTISCISNMFTVAACETRQSQEARQSRRPQPCEQPSLVELPEAPLGALRDCAA